MSKPNEGDSSITMFLLIGLLAVAVYGIWYLFREQIIDIIRFVRVGQLYVIGWFADSINMPDGSKVTPAQLYDWLASSRADNLSWAQLATVTSTVVPQFMRWPAAVLLMCLAVVGYRYSPRRKLRRSFTLEDLINAQSIAWPVISPVTKINPAIGPQRAPGDSMPAKLPVFAEAMSPEEFISFNHIPMENKTPDRDAVTRVFTRQLGQRWQGFDKLPMHYQALAAVFATKGARKRDAADQLLNEIALSWSPKTGLVLSANLKSRIKQILRDPKVGGEAAKIMSAHAYAVPGMFRLLLWARERGGVLAAATFLWLRAVDRSLWYPLNNAGRRTFHAEAAGAVAHYYAEKFLRRPLIIPKVQGAVESIIDHMKETEVAIPPAAAPPRKIKSQYTSPQGSDRALTATGGRA